MCWTLGNQLCWALIISLMFVGCCATAQFGLRGLDDDIEQMQRYHESFDPDVDRVFRAPVGQQIRSYRQMRQVGSPGGGFSEQQEVVQGGEQQQQPSSYMGAANGPMAPPQTTADPEDQALLHPAEAKMMQAAAAAGNQKPQIPLMGSVPELPQPTGALGNSQEGGDPVERAPPPGSDSGPPVGEEMQQQQPDQEGPAMHQKIDGLAVRNSLMNNNMMQRGPQQQGNNADHLRSSMLDLVKASLLAAQHKGVSPGPGAMVSSGTDAGMLGSRLGFSAAPNPAGVRMFGAQPPVKPMDPQAALRQQHLQGLLQRIARQRYEQQQRQQQQQQQMTIHHASASAGGPPGMPPSGPPLGNMMGMPNQMQPPGSGQPGKPSLLQTFIKNLIDRGRGGGGGGGFASASASVGSMPMPMPMPHLAPPMHPSMGQPMQSYARFFGSPAEGSSMGGRLLLPGYGVAGQQQGDPRGLQRRPYDGFNDEDQREPGEVNSQFTSREEQAPASVPPPPFQSGGDRYRFRQGGDRLPPVRPQPSQYSGDIGEASASGESRGTQTPPSWAARGGGGPQDGPRGTSGEQQGGAKADGAGPAGGVMHGSGSEEEDDGTIIAGHKKAWRSRLKAMRDEEWERGVEQSPVIKGTGFGYKPEVSLKNRSELGRPYIAIKYTSPPIIPEEEELSTKEWIKLLEREEQVKKERAINAIDRKAKKKKKKRK